MAAAGFFVFTLEMLLLTSAISESLKFQFKPPSTSSTDVVLTPDLPNDFFEVQEILVKFNPIASHYLSRATYIYPILGADLCNNTTIVALEFCFRERKNQLDQRRSHFDFFTLVEQEQDPNVLEITYSATATSTLTRANCSGMTSTSTVICCSYQILPSPPPQSNVNYIGITNIREYPTLLRLPNGYNGSYSMRTVNIPAADFSIIDKRQFLQVDDGDMPALRMYYRVTTEPLPTTDITTESTHATHNGTLSQEESSLNQDLLVAVVIGGCAILVFISTLVAAIVLAIRYIKDKNMSTVATVQTLNGSSYQVLYFRSSNNRAEPHDNSVFQVGRNTAVANEHGKGPLLIPKPFENRAPVSENHQILMPRLYEEPVSPGSGPAITPRPYEDPVPVGEKDQVPTPRPYEEPVSPGSGPVITPKPYENPVPVAQVPIPKRYEDPVRSESGPVSSPKPYEESVLMAQVPTPRPYEDPVPSESGPVSSPKPYEEPVPMAGKDQVPTPRPYEDPVPSESGPVSSPKPYDEPVPMAGKDQVPTPRPYEDPVPSESGPVSSPKPYEEPVPMAGKYQVPTQTREYPVSGQCPVFIPKPK